MTFNELQKKVKQISPTIEVSKIGQTIVVSLPIEKFAAAQSEDEIYKKINERIKKIKQMKVDDMIKKMESDFV